MSIYQGTFPESLKTARVIPIFKGENEQLVHNYRPISVLPFYSNFFEDNHVFYQYQFGFRKNHSTSHAIIALVEKVSKALDTGKYVMGLFLDLKKHLILLIIIYCLKN